MNQRQKILIGFVVICTLILLGLFIWFVFSADRAKAALTEFQISGIPSSMPMESALTFTVTAVEDGHTMTDYIGTIHFTSSDPSATPPADYTFTLADAGVKTFSSSFLFGSTGTYSVTVADGAISQTQSNILVFNGHANGSLIKTTSSAAVYYTQNGQRSLIPSASVFESQFFWNQIAGIATGEMNNYQDYSSEPTMHYREGTLFKAADSPLVYVVEDQKKRPIDSDTTFMAKGYNWSAIRLAESQAILDLHPTGDTLTMASALPKRTLMKTANSPAVYIIDGSNRRLLPAPSVLLSQFRWQDICLVSESTMSSYPTGADWLYRNGSIIKGPTSPAVYFIEDGKKRTFSSPMFFNGLGYDFVDDLRMAESSAILDGYSSGNTMYLLAKYIDIIGDTQRNPTVHQQVVNLITNDKPYLVFNSGDLVDDCSSLNGWAIFDTINNYLRSNTYYLPALGNHDVNCANFQARFGTNKWWSMNKDNIHYIILDTYSDLALGSDQYNWLSNDLVTQPAATRFTIAIFHRPPYTGGLNDAVALFEANGVDLLFNGHIHCYERAITNGITYMINGRGGADPLVDPCHHTIDTQHYESSFGYVRLLLNNNQLELKAYNNSGALVDSANIIGV